VACALTVFVKWASRNDRHAFFRKEDCAVGQELAVASIFALLIAAPGLARQAIAAKASPDAAVAAVFFALILIVGLWIISTVVRKAGWRDANTLRTWTGLLIPLLFGIIALLLTTWWIVKNI
jgi:hypothetical protein